jgi:cytochrome b6-f complex iron-sulfur subunit
MAEPGHEKMGRRDFLLNVGVVAGLVVAAGGSLLYGLRFLLPGLIEPTERRIRIGSEDSVPDGEAVYRSISGVSFNLVNQGGTIRAFSSICTHLGCQVTWVPGDMQFFCPCHLGYFDANGVNVAGPPPRPLDEYDVEIAGGSIYVYVPLPPSGGGIET